MWAQKSERSWTMAVDVEEAGCAWMRDSEERVTLAGSWRKLAGDGAEKNPHRDQNEQNV